MTFESKTSNLSTADLAGAATHPDTRESETSANDTERFSSSPQTAPGTHTDTLQRDVPDSERVSDASPMSQARADSASRADEEIAQPDTTTVGSSGAPSSTTARPSANEAAAPLFPANDAEQYRSRWSDIQAGFVDEPRRAVEGADSLVAEVMKRLAETFAQERSTLEGQWDRGDNMDTEQLRLALRRYRSFFDRLLSV